MNSCIEEINHAKIKVEECKRKATFLNPDRHQYIRGRIDGCLIKEGIRADYLVSGEGKTVIVELKGCNVSHACEQLMKAVAHENVKPFLVGKVGFLIICSRYPSDSTSVQRARERARKKFGAKLLVFTNERDVSITIF